MLKQLYFVHRHTQDPFNSPDSTMYLYIVQILARTKQSPNILKQMQPATHAINTVSCFNPCLFRLPAITLLPQVYCQYPLHRLDLRDRLLAACCHAHRYHQPRHQHCASAHVLHSVRAGRDLRQG